MGTLHEFPVPNHDALGQVMCPCGSWWITLDVVMARLPGGVPRVTGYNTVGICRECGEPVDLLEA